MTAPVLWIWDIKGNLLYEGAFNGAVLATGKAAIYRHLCRDGIKAGIVLTKEMVDKALILDTIDFEKDGELNVRFQ
jgi:hypothetical protein